MEPPQTRYARAGDVSIAYQVVGEGPLDLVHIPGVVSHVDIAWEHPGYARLMRRLASFARVITYDKRGMGLSDPVAGPPAVEERVDDTRAVMDAVGVERAVMFGCSEGSVLAAYFAATHPQRVSHAVLYGTFARLRPDPPEYPWGYDDAVFDHFIEGAQEAWGEGIVAILVAPSILDDPVQHRWWGRYERASTSPRTALELTKANLDLDIRDVLPTIGVPTLVLHRDGDAIPIEGARYVAERIPGARMVELRGDDHWPWLNDPDEVADHIEEFVTGQRAEPDPDRVLATVLFTDIVGSTDRAAALGDRRWRDLLHEHERLTSEEIVRHRGREVKSTGDGVLATFDGPARGIRCARAIAERVRALGLEVRAGLHAGECELRDGDIGGIAVHIGARVMAAAGPSEVLVSSTVKDLTVGSDISFEERGARQLKGVPGEWRIYAVA